MGSDSVMKGSVPAFCKDFGKKKRPNRLAKLKQCKRDAKRDQWLSQANKNKGCKEETNTGVVVSLPLSVHLITVDEPKRRPLGNSRGDDENEGLSVRDCDVEFIANSPTSSSVMGSSIDSNSRKDRPGSSCGSSSSCCYSGTISEEEDDGCLDDWEAVADALTAAEEEEDKLHLPKSDLSIEQEEATVGSLVHTEVPNMGSGGGGGGCGLKPECKKEAPVAANARAWRPDDAFRPQSLPNLLKHKSFPITWSCHSIISQPSSCPICYEDLDLTDSSFLPCSCGFHLCLFCHKRILEADGRCPGCRKQYDPINGDTGINGDAPHKRVTRSSSMTA